MTKKVSFFLENLALFEIMWKIFAETDRAQMKIWLMRIARWITQGTKTHYAYSQVIDIDIFVNCNCVDTRWQ